MAERAGKGYSAATSAKGKAVAHRPGSLKEKVNEPVKTPIHVEIDSSSDSEGFVEEIASINFKSNGKAAPVPKASGKKSSTESLTSKKAAVETPAPKGQSGKGGRPSYGKARGKGSVAPKPPVSDADLKLELDMPEKSRVLMDCEAAEVLQGIQEHMAILSEDPCIKIPESFDKAFQYAKRGNHYSDAKSVREALQSLKSFGVNDGEICLLANICPENVEEVYALIPSLKANKQKNKGPIESALNSLGTLKKCK